jgi:predicted transcriptional regulator
MTRLRIQNALGLKGKANFKNRYQKPALADSLVELTIPDKPTSSKQKYRLTEKGQMILRNK